MKLILFKYFTTFNSKIWSNTTCLKLLTLFFFLMTSSLKAQDINAHSPKPITGSHQQRDADKKKIKQQKKIEKNNETARKQHLKLQSKNTKKMMRKSSHSSKRWNENKKEFFLKRWFKKKHR